MSQKQPELQITRVLDDGNIHNETFETLRQFMDQMNCTTPPFYPEDKVGNVIIQHKETCESLGTIKDTMDYCNALQRYRPKEQVTIRFNNAFAISQYEEKDEHLQKIEGTIYKTSRLALLKHIIAMQDTNNDVNPDNVDIDLVKKTATYTDTIRIDRKLHTFSHTLKINHINDDDIVDIHVENESFVVKYKKTKDISNLLDDKETYDAFCRDLGFRESKIVYSRNAAEHPVTKIRCEELMTEEKHTLMDWILEIQRDKNDCEIHVAEGAFYFPVGMEWTSTRIKAMEKPIRHRINRIVSRVWRVEIKETYAYYILLEWETDTAMDE